MRSGRSSRRNLVSFDIEPPLRHLGAEAKWKNWEKVFTIYELPLEYEIRDLTVLVDGDLAVVYSVNRISGTLANGAKTDQWVRWTAAWQRIDGQWMIVARPGLGPDVLPRGSGRAGPHALSHSGQGRRSPAVSARAVSASDVVIRRLGCGAISPCRLSGSWAPASASVWPRL